MAETKIEWADYTFNPWRGCEHMRLADGTVHPACEHCYAEAMSKRNPAALGAWGPPDVGRRVMAAEKYWQQPLKWNNQAMVWPLHVELCRQQGIDNPILEWERRDNGNLPDPKLMERPRVFCASLADVFEDWQGPIHDHFGNVVHVDNQGKMQGIVEEARNPDFPAVFEATRRATLDDLRRDLFKLIDATPYLDWLLLTKRPENVRRMWLKRNRETCRTHCERGDGITCPAESCDIDDGLVSQHRPNVWIGTSVSDQATADLLVPELLKLRDLTPVLFLSIEPLLGPVNLHRKVMVDNETTVNFYDPLTGQYNFNGRDQFGGPSLDWIIVGGESGPHARPMHPDWARSLRDQCQAAGVPFMFKQWGEWEPDLGQPLGATRIAHKCGDEAVMHFARVGKKAAGRLLDGREWSEVPQPSRAPSPEPLAPKAQ